MNNTRGALSFEATINNNQFRQAIRQQESDIRSFTSQLASEGQKWDNTFKKLGVAVGSVFAFSQANRFISDIVRVRGEFQQLDIAFTTMLQSKEKSDKLMSELITFAATTPFGLKETATAAKQLLAYGSAAETVQAELRMLGDVAAGVSQPIGELTYLYGTLRTQGRAYAVDIRQFAGRGIPIYTELAKVLGISKDRVAEFVEAGKVGFKEVEQAFKNMTAQGSMFGGLMDAQSKSIPGQIERVKDAWEQLLNKIGTDNQEIIEGAISGVSSLVENYQMVGKVLTGLVATYGTYKAAVMAVSAMTAAYAVTAGQAATAEAISASVKADNALTTANLTRALAAETAARAAAAEATLAQLRAEYMEVSAKEVVAEETARLAVANLAAAEANLVAAKTSAVGVIGAEEQMIAVKRVAAAQNELLVASEANLAASRALTSATADVNTKKYLIDTAAKEANTLSNVANAASTQATTAATAADIAVTNAAIVSNTKLTAGQALRYAATKRLVAIQTLLNKLMLTNPYVLMAVAVTGIVSAVWALHDASTAQERVQKRLNEQTEKAREEKEKLTSETNRLIGIIRDENSTLYAQLVAYEELQKMMPSYFGTMDLASFKAKDAAVAQREFNAAMDRLDIARVSSQYDVAKQKLQDLIDKYGDYEKEAKKVGNYDGTAKIVNNLFEEARNYLEESKKAYEEMMRLQAQSAEIERVKSLPVAQQIQYYEQIKKELEAQRFALENSLLLARQTGKEFSHWQQTLDSVNLEKLNNRLKDTLNMLAGLRGESKVKNKSFFDEEAKKAKEAYEMIPIDQLGSPQAKQAKKDYEEATKAAEAYSLKEKKAPKPKKDEIAKPEGSLAEFDRQIRNAEKTLSQIPASQVDRIKAMQETLLQLTEQRVEAAKIVEFRNWDETLSYKRDQYAKFEAAIEAGYGDSAKKQFAPLFAEGENYISFLQNQIKPMEDALYGGGNLSQRDFERLVTLTGELNAAMAVTTPMEKFKERLDNAKDSAANISDYIASLRSELERLNNMPASERDGAWYAQFKDLTNRLKSANQEAVAQLKAFLEQVKGHEAQRRAIEKKYADLREKAEAKDIPFVDKAEKKELNDFAFESSKAFKDMNKVIIGDGVKSIELYIEKLTKLYVEAIKVYGPLSNEAKEALNRLNGEKQNLQDFKTQNWINFAQVIGQAGGELAEMEGVLGSIGSLLVGAAGAADSFANSMAIAKKNSSGNGSTGETVSAAASGVGNLVGMFVASRKKKKAERKQRELNEIDFQVQMNAALTEEIRLRTILSENVFFKDYAGRVTDAMNASFDAVDKYNKALSKLMINGKALEGTANKIDWGNVAGGAITGAAAGAVAGSVIPIIGTAVGAVVGAVVGGVVGLISTATKSLYGPLLQTYPQLINANGTLNKSLAETLITTDQVDDKTKLWLQDLINATDAYEEARKQITEIISELTGSIGTELRDVLVDAFQTGEDAAYQFSKTVQKTLENALSNLIYSAVFSKAFSNLQKNLEDSLMGSGRSFADVFREFLTQSNELTKKFNEAMNVAQEEARKQGFNIFDGESGGNNSASAGISRALSEETGSLISGQMNALRITSAATYNILNVNLPYLQDIAHNTSYLISIDRRMARLESNGGLGRALGLSDEL